eukprot:12634880-Ditylum_brightwellii.AAC.1
MTIRILTAVTKKATIVIRIMAMGVCMAENKDGMLRVEVMGGDMLCLIEDISDPNHFWKPELTKQHIIDHSFTLKELKEQLPKFKRHTDTCSKG